MKEYHAKLNNSLTFDIAHEGRSIGKLLYKGWFKFDALIELSNQLHYQVEPKGFWATTIEVKDNGKVLLDFRMNWSGEIVIQTRFDEIEKGYIFKHRGFFKDSFVLTDADGQELLVMIPHLKWKLMNYEYQITTSDIFDTLPHQEVLLMTAVHGANYYMAMAAGVAAS